MLNHISFLISIVMLIYSNKISAQPTYEYNESPYLQIISENAEVDKLNLIGTDVEVNIAGCIADVIITQQYKNNGKVPIEAIYVFPSSTKSAVYDMEMRIGDRRIKAQIQEKSQARNTYEKAKSKGQRASLLEQHNPNVFQMNVANIRPGDQVDIIMKYTEVLISKKGEYEFVFPTVIGPRYQSPSDNHPLPKIKYTKAGAKPNYNFDIKINLHSPIAVQAIRSPSHKTKVKYLNTNEVQVYLDPNEIKSGNKDFIFQYSMSGDQITSGTILYEHQDEKFFLSIVEPPVRISQDDILPREFIFIVDVSGSMHGFPIETSKQLMQNLLSKLRPFDYFNVLLFASNSEVLFEESQQASYANIERAQSILNNVNGGGSTEMLSAIRRGMSLPRKEDRLSRSFLIISDGYVNVEREAFDYIQNNIDKANFFSFGIGSSVNRFIMEGIAHAGKGEAFIVTDPQYASSTAKEFQEYIEAPLLSNLQISYHDMDIYDAPTKLPDLLSEKPLYIFGKYRGKADGYISIKGNGPSGKYSKIIPFGNKAKASEDHAAIRYLWARERLRNLSDFQGISNLEEEKRNITNLALRYNLLSQYTSFVAVEELPYVDDLGEECRTVNQVLPLPQGVSNHAIGFDAAASGISSNLSKLPESTLFVDILDLNDRVLKSNLEKIIKDKLSLCDSELKKKLNTNTLTVHISKGEITVIDKSLLLNTQQRKMIAELLFDLLKYAKKKTSLSIKLFWL